MKRSILLLVALAAVAGVRAQHEGFYRFPTLVGQTLVFGAEGDLWRVSLTGGAAHRLTTHPAEEAYPVLSPDGKWVAFSGGYEGPGELYVMSVEGGLPTRLTWDGSAGTRPVSWTSDGKIVFRTTRESGLPNYTLSVIDPVSREREPVPLAQAADGTYDPDGTLWFVRLPRQSSNARWYKGGTAQIMWKFVPGTPEAEPVTGDWPGTSKEPRIVGSRVYFLSDRAGRGMNVWSMGLDGSDVRRHTDYMEWDIQEHTASGTNLVYRLGADLYRMDLTSDRTERIPITLVSDFDQRRETWEEKPLESVSSWNVSPDGKKVVLVSRGEVFVAPVGKDGRRVHVSADSGVRYRTARFSADGKAILAISDKSGELEWWTLSVDGMVGPSQITRGPAMLRLDGEPSPDGQWLAHTDYDRNVWLVNLNSGDSRKISEPSVLWSGQGTTLNWSADSKLLAYETTAKNRMSSLYVYDIASGSTSEITTDRYEDYAPAFSPDGSWLYFLSDRSLVSSVGSPWGARAPQPHFDRQTRIYGIPLREGARFPFSPMDELTPDSSATPAPVTARKPGAGGPAREAGSTSTLGPLRLDLAHRIQVAPVERGDYGELKTNGKRLFYLARDKGADLKTVDLKPHAEPVTLVEGVSGYELSADGSSILVRKGSTFAVIAAGAGAGVKLEEGAVDLKDWRVPVSPQDEWQQIYVDAWRLHRDYFWDPAMHGVDWPSVRAQYQPLVARVASREELSDIIGQMVSHLSLLHSNVAGGDNREGPDQVQPASLGARLEPAPGGLRVAHVYGTDPDEPESRSPLARAEPPVREGAIVVSIDGSATAGHPDAGPFLRGKAGSPVRLRLLESGKERDVVIEAISMSQESDLRYDEWEYTRRLETDEASQEQIGYVHIRAMSTGNIAEWSRGFYPVFNRPGLIVDVRHNNGGNIEAWILGDLMRKAWMYFKGRTGDPFWNMHFAFTGHVVVLVDERTASDGEAFADGFRRLGLGDVIGARTWGGEVWLSGSNRQVDGGVARASEGGVYGPEGEWLIEGWGVVPDIEVDNLPHATYQGSDAQLQAAIEHLQRLIALDPRAMPEPPPYPIVVPGQGFPTPWKGSGG